MKTLFLLTVASCALYAEDFVYTQRSNSFEGTVSGYDNVTAEGYDYGFNGGVGRVKQNAQYSISGNGNVTFTGNSTEAKGGVFHVNASSWGSPQVYTELNVTDNTGKVIFSANYAETGGGAINAESNSGYPDPLYSVTNISGNNEVSFTGNNADDDGGAIRSNGKLIINNNGLVEFTGNAVNKANGNWGGAIYLGGNDTGNALQICGNDRVEFRGNYLIKPQSTYVPQTEVRLNAVYQIYTNSTNVISAKTGGEVVFYDSFKSASAGNSASYELNADYTDSQGVVQSAAGIIRFSGLYVEEDLAAYTGALGVVSDSLTSTFSADTVLHNGILSIEDAAILQAKNLMIESGAELVLSDGSFEALTDGCLEFVAGSVLDASGVNAVSAESIIFGDDVTFELNLSEINLEEALINLSASELSYGTATIEFSGMDKLAEGCYKVLDFSDSSLKNSADWSVAEITVKGLTSGDSFSWNDDRTVLFLKHEGSSEAEAVPESGSATLSLLALAGLVMRRRRR